MRVSLKTKNKGIKHATYRCQRCSDPIKAGDEYYEWKFKHAEPSRQHKTHGAPRQSQLCNGKMSGVYAAVEGVEDDIKAARNSRDIGGLADVLNSAAEEVRNVKDEYESGLSNMPDSLQQSSTGEQIQEKIDALETFADELESAASDVEGFSDELDGLEEPGKPDAEEIEPSGDEQADDDARDDAEQEAEDEYESALETYHSECSGHVEQAIDRAEEAVGSLNV